MGKTPRTTVCLAGALATLNNVNNIRSTTQVTHRMYGKAKNGKRGLTSVPRESRTKSRGGWTKKGEKDLRWRKTGTVKSDTRWKFTIDNAEQIYTGEGGFDSLLIAIDMSGDPIFSTANFAIPGSKGFGGKFGRNFLQG